MRRRLRPFIAAVAMLLSLAAAAPARAAAPEDEDPAWYAKKATWVETLEAARDAFAEAMTQPGARPPLPDFGEDDFTVTAWVRTRKGGTILAKAPAEGKWAPQGKTLFVRGGRLAYDVGWVGNLTGKTNLADGEWHHAALVKDGETLRLLVDGEVDKEGSLDAGPDVPEHVLKIGTTSANFPAPSGLAGSLDHVCLFGRALSPEEVRAAAKAFDPTAMKGLAACWTFDDGHADSSAAGHDGFVRGEVAWPEGKVGRAIRLDGAAHVVVSAEAGFAHVWPLLKRDFPDVDPLFDGDSLAGWHKRNRAGHASGAAWEVTGGAITGVQELPGGIGMLVTREAYEDADLRLQVRCDAPLEAGIHLRMGGFAGGWEVTLHCRDGGDVAGVACGGFFDRVHKRGEGWKKVWKPDDWNDLRIVIRGHPPTIRTYLNGKAMTAFNAEGVELDDPPPARGPIALKVSGPEPCFNHRLRVRRARVRRLK
ncbi:MAG: family 16 glycoside hydrolase [Phycisphaerae bacterium]